MISSLQSFLGVLTA